MKQELDDKDRKIKELNIRLDAQRRQSSANRQSKEINDNLFGAQDLSNFSFTTILDDNRNSLLPPLAQLTQGNTGNNSNNAYVQDLEKQIEQKEEEIILLRNKLEV